MLPCCQSWVTQLGHAREKSCDLLMTAPLFHMKPSTFVPGLKPPVRDRRSATVSTCTAMPVKT